MFKQQSTNKPSWKAIKNKLLNETEPKNKVSRAETFKKSNSNISPKSKNNSNVPAKHTYFSVENRETFIDSFGKLDNNSFWYLTSTSNEANKNNKIPKSVKEKIFEYGKICHYLQ